MQENEASLKDTIGLVLRLALRRRWLILLVAFGTSLATIAVALLLPDRYTSEATLAVVQQQISQKYVQPVANTTAVSAITALSREVLSRNRLLTIIDEFGLYRQQKKNLSAQDLVERMRKDVEIEPMDRIPGADDFSAFRIAFTAENPHLAQMVTSRLTSLFIEENLKTRGDQATRTTDFLTEQLKGARQKLEEQGQHLREFKSRNLNELPEHQPVNLGALTDLRLQLQNTTTNLNRTQQEHTSLESSLAGILLRLRAERTDLLTRFTARHPDVIKKDQDIAATDALLSRLIAGGGVGKAEVQVLPDFLSAMKTQVEANLAAKENLSDEQQRLRAEIVKYENGLNLTPIREQELAGILRDYDSYRQDYQELLNKQIQSQLTASLEEHLDGQQFRLTDAPTLPILPSSPKRVGISLGGVLAGLGLGMAFAFLMEGRNRSFHSDKELKQQFPMLLVLGVPVLLTPAEERGRHWKRAFEWAAATAMAVIVCAAEFYVYKRG